MQTIDPPRAAAALGALAVETDCSEARLGARVLPLTWAQRRVLLVLVGRGGRAMTRDDLYEEAFGRPLPDGSRAVDLHIGRIRRALGTHARALVSIDRVGYRLDPDLLR